VTAALVIHKYRLPFKSERSDVVEVPVRVGRLLHVALQHGEIHAWAAVDPGWPEVAHRFRLAGTGAPIDPSWHHLGTVLDGAYVWHIFSEKPMEAADV
jgi:hypothetical protein